MRHVMKNGTVFTSPITDVEGKDPIEWRLRHNQVSIDGSDMMLVASMLDSYQHLIMSTSKKRSEVMSQMKNDILKRVIDG